jgi:hypothetical protein
MHNDWKNNEYLLLSTQKRDGSWVDTPIWFGQSERNGERCFYCFSEGKAGKVKRIRNFTAVKIQTCTVLGKPTGQFEPASAYLLDAEDADIAHKSLLKQYGYKMRLLDFGSWLARKKDKRAFIRLDFN